MSIFKSLFGRRTSAAQKVLGAMELFTSAALLMVPSSDYESDDTRSKRLYVFLFGAIDALIQQHSISGVEMFDTLGAYLRQTFPSMRHKEVQTVISFLTNASADPAWVPIIRHGGQTMVDWSRGDSTAPARLLKVVHYGDYEHSR